jgi:hypothetical protein
MVHESKQPIPSHNKVLFSLVLELKNKKRIPFFKNEPRKLLEIKVWPPKTKLNEPENEARKLLKIRSCGKNEPKNEPGHFVENKQEAKTDWELFERNRDGRVFQASFVRGMAAENSFQVQHAWRVMMQIIDTL